MVRTTGIFAIGFVLGLLFAYTGLVGFTAGALTGIIVAQESPEGVERATISATQFFASGWVFAQEMLKNAQERQHEETSP